MCLMSMLECTTMGSGALFDSVFTAQYLCVSSGVAFMVTCQVNVSV